MFKFLKKNVVVGMNKDGSYKCSLCGIVHKDHTECPINQGLVPPDPEEKKVIEDFLDLLAQKQKAKGKNINGGVFNNTIIDIVGTARFFDIKELCGQKIGGEDAVKNIWKILGI